MKLKYAFASIVFLIGAQTHAEEYSVVNAIHFGVASVDQEFPVLLKAPNGCIATADGFLTANTDALVLTAISGCGARTRLPISLTAEVAGNSDSLTADTLDSFLNAVDSNRNSIQNRTLARAKVVAERLSKTGVNTADEQFLVRAGQSVDLQD